MKYPYHAISNVDCFGMDAYKSDLPRIEEDFATLPESIRFLAENGGGAVEYFDGKKYSRVQNVNPGGSGEVMALTA
jgi:hypothetical protein